MFRILLIHCGNNYSSNVSKTQNLKIGENVIFRGENVISRGENVISRCENVIFTLSLLFFTLLIVEYTYSFKMIVSNFYF